VSFDSVLKPRGALPDPLPAVRGCDAVADSFGFAPPLEPNIILGFVPASRDLSGLAAGLVPNGEAVEDFPLSALPASVAAVDFFARLATLLGAVSVAAAGVVVDSGVPTSWLIGSGPSACSVDAFRFALRGVK
jgi:hypothetical protein